MSGPTSVIGGKADMSRTCQYVRYDPKRTFHQDTTDPFGSRCGPFLIEGRLYV